MIFKEMKPLRALKSKQQEDFVQGIMSGLSQRKAYRVAYPTFMTWTDGAVDT